MLSKWIYILIGDNDTGKSTFQKRLIYHLTGEIYSRLDRNRDFEITHEYAPKKLGRIFLMSRSYQETRGEYQAVGEYFNDCFKNQDVCILSSHATAEAIGEIKEMIKEGRKRKYNIGGVFWTNCDNDEVAAISLLDWDERFLMDNPKVEGDDVWQEQVDFLAWEFAEMLVRRAMT